MKYMFAIKIFLIILQSSTKKKKKKARFAWNVAHLYS